MSETARPSGTNDRSASGRARTVIGWAVAVAVAGLVGVGVVVGITRDYSPQPTVSMGEVSNQRVGIDLYPQGDREPLPLLEGPAISGDQLSTADYGGKVLVINLWGSWCAPCRTEAPDLTKISKAMASEGVQFLGINTRDTPGNALAFQKNFGFEYPSFDDQQSDVLLDISDAVPISAVPSTIFVDVEGNIAGRAIGEIDGSTLQGIIDDLLAEDTEATDTP